MTKQKHTPGPWEAHHQTAHLCAGDCDWSLQSQEAGAFLLFCHHPDAPADANARLIAAAPQMLAALEQVVRFCDVDTDPIIRATAMAAITEATGQS